MDACMSMSACSMDCPPLVDVAGEAAQFDRVIRPNSLGVHTIGRKIIPITETDLTPSEPFVCEMYSVVNVDGTYIPVERVSDGSRPQRGIMSEAAICAQPEFENSGWGHGQSY